ncbi:MAG: GMC oxidoreductase [Nostoc sp.]
MEVGSGADVTNDAAIEAYIREVCSTVYHPVGTCKMALTQ